MAILSSSKIVSLITQSIEEFISSPADVKILISPFDAKSLGPASYDLHIGDQYISLSGRPNVKHIGERPLRIQPGESLTIVSREYIGLPHNIAGMVSSRVSWLEQGLTQISTYVHPGFHGYLSETLTNVIDNAIEVDPGSPFCQIVFLEVPEGTVDEQYVGKRRGQTVDTIMERLTVSHQNPRRVEAMQPQMSLNVAVKRVWNNVRPDNIKFKQVRVDRRTGDIIGRTK